MIGMDEKDENKKEKPKPILTYQLNPLIEAQKDFDVMETRLFYLGLQDVNPHISQNDKYYDTQFPDTLITPAQLTEIFGHSQYITEVDRATDRLIGRYISIYFQGGFEKYTIFQHIKYKPEQGLFIKFNEDMRKFILEIYENYKNYGFTKIDMQQIFFLSSAYAMRILELLLQYKNTANNGIIEREVSIDELRKMLNVPDGAYKGRISNFRQKVLDLPINDINKNTQYHVSYEPIKYGRRVKGFKFTCNCNNVIEDDEFTETIESKPTPEKRDSPALPEHQTEEEKTYMKFIHYGFSTKTVKKLLEVCGGDLDELASRLEYGEKRAEQDRKKGKKIPSISGYLRTAIEENWLGQNKDVERAKQREIEAERTNADWELWAKKEFSNEPIPDVPETPFENEGIEKVMINMIKKDIINRNLCYSSKARLQEHGMTVARFIELYMEG